MAVAQKKHGIPTFGLSLWKCGYQNLRFAPPPATRKPTPSAFGPRDSASSLRIQALSTKGPEPMEAEEATSSALSHRFHVFGWEGAIRAISRIDYRKSSWYPTEKSWYFFLILTSLLEDLDVLGGWLP